MKQLSWRKITLWAFSLALFAFVWSLIPWAELQKVVQILSFKSLAALFVLNLVIVLTMSGRWWFILRGLGYSVNYFKLSGYRLAAFGVSYFTPGPQFGGEPLQVWVLTNKHQIPTSSALASVTVDKLLELFINFAVLALGVIVVLQTAIVPIDSAGWLLIAALLLGLAPVFLLWTLAQGMTPLTNAFRWLHSRPMLQTLAERFEDRISQLDQAILDSEVEVTRLYRQSPKAILLAFLISGVTWLLWLLEFWLMYRLLGAALSLTELFIVLTAVRIAFLLPLPAGLGTLEASQYVAMTAIGQAAAIGLSGTVFIRVRDFLIAGFGLWLSSRLVSRFVSRESKTDLPNTKVT